MAAEKSIIRRMISWLLSGAGLLAGAFYIVLLVPALFFIGLGLYSYVKPYLYPELLAPTSGRPYIQDESPEYPEADPNDPRELLLQAIRRNELDKIPSLVARGGADELAWDDPKNYIYVLNFTPMRLAMNMKNYEAARKLVEAGVRPDSYDGAFGVAIYVGQDDLARFFLENGANPNDVFGGAGPLNAALMVGDLEMADTLVAAGATPWHGGASLMPAASIRWVLAHEPGLFDDHITGLFTQADDLAGDAGLDVAYRCRDMLQIMNDADLATWRDYLKTGKTMGPATMDLPRADARNAYEFCSAVRDEYWDFKRRLSRGDAYYTDFNCPTDFENYIRFEHSAAHEALANQTPISADQEIRLVMESLFARVPDINQLFIATDLFAELVRAGHLELANEMLDRGYDMAKNYNKAALVHYAELDDHDPGRISAAFLAVLEAGDRDLMQRFYERSIKGRPYEFHSLLYAVSKARLDRERKHDLRVEKFIQSLGIPVPQNPYSRQEFLNPPAEFPPAIRAVLARSIGRDPDNDAIDVHDDGP